MKMVRTGIFLGFFFNLSCALGASVPNALLYQSKPIDSLCFYEVQDAKHTVNLKQCGLHAEPGRYRTGYNNYLLDKGFIGFDYEWNIDSQSKSHGYSYYKPLGMLKQAAIIETLNNSGGTGQFSTISLMTRNNHDITVKAYDGGDRCNHGIVDVKRMTGKTHDKLEYSVNLTSYDFLMLAEDNPHGLEAYTDLASCAACCQATAVFERPINENFANETLLYVDLNAYPLSEDNSEGSVTYQTCFDTLLAEYKEKYKAKLTPETLKQFTNAFNARCVKKQAKRAV